MKMRIVDFRLSRFEFARDRVIGDSQISSRNAYFASLELIAEDGTVGLGFMNSMMFPLPAEDELSRVFAAEVWPALDHQCAASLIHSVSRPRGGNNRRLTLPFEEAIQHALWDLYAKSMGLPLWQLLGASRRKVRTYASGLDFHLSDDEFSTLFSRAVALGFTAFKIKVGHPEIDRDIHRLDLLKKMVGAKAAVMVDANEAWSAKQAERALTSYRRAGHDILWLEDPVLRADFDGLRLLRTIAGPTMINSGEYLDLTGRRQLLQSGATDMLNVQGQVTDVMRIGWLAADMGVPLTMGNSFLELGVNMALALPEVEWLEYSFLNLEHLVDQPYKIENGYIWGSDAPGHGLVLNQAALREWRRPTPVPATAALPAPRQFRLSG
jgi:L-alanine-DL-glutamate epimerase-like enolase superfamily enzyme